MKDDELAKHILNDDSCYNCNNYTSHTNIWPVELDYYFENKDDKAKTFKDTGGDIIYEHKLSEVCSNGLIPKCRICESWKTKGPDLTYGSFMPIYTTKHVGKKTFVDKKVKWTKI